MPSNTRSALIRAKRVIVINKRSSLRSIIALGAFDPSINNDFKKYNGKSLQIEKIYEFVLNHYKNKKNVYLGSFSDNDKHVEIKTKELLEPCSLRGGNTLINGDTSACIYNNNLINSITSNINKDYIFIPLILMTIVNGVSRGHANMIVIYPKIKKMIRFDPYGSKAFLKETDLLLKEMIRKEFRELKFKYVTPTELCINGPQTFEKLKKQEIGKGYCMIFSLLFIIYTLELDPNITPTKIIKMMYSSPTRTGKQVNIEVRRFTNFILAVNAGKIIMNY